MGCDTEFEGYGLRVARPGKLPRNVLVWKKGVPFIIDADPRDKNILIIPFNSLIKCPEMGASHVGN